MRKYEENALADEVRKLNESLHALVRQHSLPYTFISAIITALGSLIGASLVFGLLGYVLSKLNFLPIVQILLRNLPNK